MTCTVPCIDGRLVRRVSQAVREVRFGETSVQYRRSRRNPRLASPVSPKSCITQRESRHEWSRATRTAAPLGCPVQRVDPWLVGMPAERDASVFKKEHDGKERIGARERIIRRTEMTQCSTEFCLRGRQSPTRDPRQERQRKHEKAAWLASVSPRNRDAREFTSSTSDEDERDSHPACA